MHPWIRAAVHRAFFSWHRPRAGHKIIFLYHSVGGGLPLSESLATFERQIHYIARWFRVVRLSEFLSTAATGAKGNIAAVTFDDGYVDNATLARAVLERAGIPGTFFVVTGLLGRNLPTSGGPRRLMTPAQVRTLAQAGHEIGAHTVTHPELPTVPASVAHTEVTDSKRFLEDLLQTAVTSFAYPHGRVNERVRQYVQEAGYRQAVSTRCAFVEEPIDPLTLPRLSISNYIRSMLRRRRS